MKVKIFISTLVFAFLVCFSISVSATSALPPPDEKEPIKTRAELINAINEAENGDTLYVSNIDFNLNGSGAINDFERITIDKSITIKNATSNEKAVFYGASFILDATKMAGASNNITFVDIVFDGKIDATDLTNEDWELSYDSEGEPISNHPLKAQYAILCKGNLNATFENCEFKSYMYEYGPAIRAFYSESSSYYEEYGNNVSCMLNLTLNNCNFNSNSALYGGGAIYLEAHNKNIEFNSKNTIFFNNQSGFVNNAGGGGAISISNLNANMYNCTLTANVANHYYGGVKPGYDQITGGAISCKNNSNLIMNSCVIANNQSSLGGGVSVVESNAEFNGCVFAKNQAIPATENYESELGIASNKGLGGALYLNDPRNVKIINTDIYSNKAQNAFGGIFANYNPLLEFATNSLEIKFSSIANNICETKMQDYLESGTDAWLWFSYPGDFLDISYMKIYASIIIDDSFEADYPRYEIPTKENNYNYFASPIKASEDGYIITLVDNLYVHKSLENTPIVPIEFVKEHLKTKDTILIGDFTVGSNAKDAIFNLYLEEGFVDTYTNEFFVLLSLPQYKEAGYTYSPWKYKSTNQNIEADKLYIVGNRQKEIDIFTEAVPNVYKITFIINDTAIEIDQVFHKPINFPELEEIKGYSFKGWYTQPNGEGMAISIEGIYKTAGNEIYYAHYEEKFPILAVVLAISLTCVVVLFVVPIIAGGIVLLSLHFKKKRKPVIMNQESSLDTNVDISSLTPREKEVLEYLLQGKTRADIGKLLFVSENTIKKQITSIYQKLSVNSRSELFAKFKNQ